MNLSPTVLRPLTRLLDGSGQTPTGNVSRPAARPRVGADRGDGPEDELAFFSLSQAEPSACRGHDVLGDMSLSRESRCHEF